MILSATNHTLNLTTSTSSEIDFTVSFVELSSTTITPATQEGQITSVTNTQICDAPTASLQRQIKAITLFNSGSAANALVLNKTAGATVISVYKTTLQPGQSAVYSLDGGWQRFDANGTPITEPASKMGIQTGYASFYTKIGTAPKAAGSPYLFSKDSGMPGAFTVSAAGLNGEAWDNSKAGGIPVTVGSGTLYLSSFSVTANQTGMYGLLDILWMNSGVTGAVGTQNITPATAAARDNNGTTNGAGVIPMLYFSGASAATAGTATLSYTNSDGTAGRTSGAVSLPTSVSVGAAYLFPLAAGDIGVRSIQSITHSAAYGGTAHLMLVRPIVLGPVLLANTGYCTSISDYKAVKVFPNSHLASWVIPTGTTATTISGVANFVEV